jgi:hypothetical protein
LTFTPTQDLTATAAVEATATAEVILGEIDAELQKVNLSTAEGSLGWMGTESLEMWSDSWKTILYEPLAGEQQFSNFVLHADITWDSTSGLAGCGLLLRSGPNLEKSKQYQFFAWRFSGLPAWNVELWEYGTWQATVTGDMKFSSAINLESNSTNRFLLVVKDTLLTVYVNDTRLSNVIVSAMSTGRIGAIIWQESGETSCIFDNVWVWELE